MYCILVSGIPASGKSMTAKMIAERLAIPYFTKDCIKERLFDTIGFTSRAEKMKLNLGATSALYYVAQQLMCARMPFVLENNFENATADEIKALIKKYSYKVVSVSLTGDYRRLYERFCERQYSPDRHRGHVINDCYPEKSAAREVPPTSYEHYLSFATRGMDKFRVDGENIIVDTTDFQSVNWNEILDRIKRYINQE